MGPLERQALMEALLAADEATLASVPVSVRPGANGDARADRGPSPLAGAMETYQGLAAIESATIRSAQMATNAAFAGSRGHRRKRG